MNAARMDPPSSAKSCRVCKDGPCGGESAATSPVATSCRRRPRQLLAIITLAGVARCIFWAPNALAQQSGRTEPPVATEASQTVAPVQNTTPLSAPSRSALTGNPLNLIIRRFGFNFEYQPVLHQGLIVTPYYDYLSGSLAAEGDCQVNTCTRTLEGAGAELGYRFYSGVHGFDGFFAGPSLLIARRKLVSENTSAGYHNSMVFNSVGGAFDGGWQHQQGHFIVGLGIGVQYTEDSKKLQLSGQGVDVLIDWYAGGGWRPRFAINLGYAF